MKDKEVNPLLPIEVSEDPQHPPQLMSFGLNGKALHQLTAIMGGAQVRRVIISGGIHYKDHAYGTHQHCPLTIKPSHFSDHREIHYPTAINDLFWTTASWNSESQTIKLFPDALLIPQGKTYFRPQATQLAQNAQRALIHELQHANQKWTLKEAITDQRQRILLYSLLHTAPMFSIPLIFAIARISPNFSLTDFQSYTLGFSSRLNCQLYFRHHLSRPSL